MREGGEIDRERGGGRKGEKIADTYTFYFKFNQDIVSPTLHCTLIEVHQGESKEPGGCSSCYTRLLAKV